MDSVKDVMSLLFSLVAFVFEAARISERTRSTSSMLKAASSLPFLLYDSLPWSQYIRHIFQPGKRFRPESSGRY